MIALATRFNPAESRWRTVHSRFRKQIVVRGCHGHQFLTAIEVGKTMDDDQQAILMPPSPTECHKKAEKHGAEYKTEDEPDDDEQRVPTNDSIYFSEIGHRQPGCQILFHEIDDLTCNEIRARKQYRSDLGIVDDDDDSIANTRERQDCLPQITDESIQQQRIESKDNTIRSKFDNTSTSEKISCKENVLTEHAVAENAKGTTKESLTSMVKLVSSEFGKNQENDLQRRDDQHRPNLCVAESGCTQEDNRTIARTGVARAKDSSNEKSVHYTLPWIEPETKDESGICRDNASSDEITDRNESLGTIGNESLAPDEHRTSDGLFYDHDCAKISHAKRLLTPGTPSPPSIKNVIEAKHNLQKDSSKSSCGVNQLTEYTRQEIVDDVAPRTSSGRFENLENIANAESSDEQEANICNGNLVMKWSHGHAGATKSSRRNDDEILEWSVGASDLMDELNNGHQALRNNESTSVTPDVSVNKNGENKFTEHRVLGTFGDRYISEITSADIVDDKHRNDDDDWPESEIKLKSGQMTSVYKPDDVSGSKQTDIEQIIEELIDNAVLNSDGNSKTSCFSPRASSESIFRALNKSSQRSCYDDLAVQSTVITVVNCIPDLINKVSTSNETSLCNKDDDLFTMVKTVTRPPYSALKSKLTDKSKRVVYQENVTVGNDVIKIDLGKSFPDDEDKETSGTHLNDDKLEVHYSDVKTLMSKQHAAANIHHDETVQVKGIDVGRGGGDDRETAITSRNISGAKNSTFVGIDVSKNGNCADEQLIAGQKHSPERDHHDATDSLQNVQSLPNCQPEAFDVFRRASIPFHYGNIPNEVSDNGESDTKGCRKSICDSMESSVREGKLLESQIISSTAASNLRNETVSDTEMTDLVGKHNQPVKAFDGKLIGIEVNEISLSQKNFKGCNSVCEPEKCGDNTSFPDNVDGNRKYCSFTAMWDIDGSGLNTKSSGEDEGEWMMQYCDDDDDDDAKGSVLMNDVAVEINRHGSMGSSEDVIVGAEERQRCGAIIDGDCSTYGDYRVDSKENDDDAFGYDVILAFNDDNGFVKPIETDAVVNYQDETDGMQTCPTLHHHKVLNEDGHYSMDCSEDDIVAGADERQRYGVILLKASQLVGQSEGVGNFRVDSNENDETFEDDVTGGPNYDNGYVKPVETGAVVGYHDEEQTDDGTQTCPNASRLYHEKVLNDDGRNETAVLEEQTIINRYEETTVENSIEYLIGEKLKEFYSQDESKLSEDELFDYNRCLDDPNDVRKRDLEDKDRMESVDDERFHQHGSCGFIAKRHESDADADADKKYAIHVKRKRKVINEKYEYVKFTTYVRNVYSDRAVDDDSDRTEFDGNKFDDDDSLYFVVNVTQTKFKTRCVVTVEDYERYWFGSNKVGEHHSDDHLIYNENGCQNPDIDHDQFSNDSQVVPSDGDNELSIDICQPVDTDVQETNDEKTSCGIVQPDSVDNEIKDGDDSADYDIPSYQPPTIHCSNQESCAEEDGYENKADEPNRQSEIPSQKDDDDSHVVPTEKTSDVPMTAELSDKDPMIRTSVLCHDVNASSRIFDEAKATQNKSGNQEITELMEGATKHVVKTTSTENRENDQPLKVQDDRSHQRLEEDDDDYRNFCLSLCNCRDIHDSGNKRPRDSQLQPKVADCHQYINKVRQCWSRPSDGDLSSIYKQENDIFQEDDDEDEPFRKKPKMRLGLSRKQHVQSLHQSTRKLNNR